MSFLRWSALAKLQTPHPRFAALVCLPIDLHVNIQACKPTLAVDSGVDADGVIEHKGSAGALDGMAANHRLTGFVGAPGACLQAVPSRACNRAARQAAGRQKKLIHVLATVGRVADQLWPRMSMVKSRCSSGICPINTGTVSGTSMASMPHDRPFMVRRTVS